MEPKIIEEHQIVLLGLSKFCRDASERPALWEEFTALEGAILHPVTHSRYAISTWGIETRKLPGSLFLYIGMEVSRIKAPPEEATIKILPRQKYAIFRAEPREVERTWMFILEEWLPAMRRRAPGYIIERFDATRYFSQRPGHREVDLYLPLR